MSANKDTETAQWCARFRQCRESIRSGIYYSIILELSILGQRRQFQEPQEIEEGEIIEIPSTSASPTLWPTPKRQRALDKPITNKEDALKVQVEALKQAQRTNKLILDSRDREIDDLKVGINYLSTSKIVFRRSSREPSTTWSRSVKLTTKPALTATRQLRSRRPIGCCAALSTLPTVPELMPRVNLLIKFRLFSRA